MAYPPDLLLRLLRSRRSDKSELAPAAWPWVDAALVKALALWWRRMLEEGACAAIKERATRKTIDHGSMNRVLGLALLAPDTVEAILNGRQPDAVRLDDMLSLSGPSNAPP